MNNNLKTNKNAGMTLLEVIIAVSIFSIAAIVLLRGFVTGSRINRKSNLYLEATSTAQNVMEEIKARPFEDVALAFNYPIDLTTGECRFTFLNPVVYDVYNGKVGIKEVKKNEAGEYDPIQLYGEDESKVTASVISRDGGKTGKFNPDKNGKYYYQMTNVRNLHETFDILVEFNGGDDSGYRKSDEKGKNDYLAPNIAKLDTKSNAFLSMGKDWARKEMDEGDTSLLGKQWALAKDLWEDEKTEQMDQWGKDHKWDEIIEENGVVVETIHHPTALERAEEEARYEVLNPKPERLDYDDVYAHCKRVLRVTLQGGNDGTPPTVIVHFALSAYDYVKEGGSKFERMDICECCKEAGGLNKRKIENEEPIDMTNCCCTFDSTDMTFYSAEADHELKNIYVFYFPNYNSRNSSDPLDDLRFYNKGGIPVTFNLTKERDEEKGIPTQSEEMGYRMNFTVKEEAGSKSGDWDSELGAYKALTKFNTNLNYDISKHEEISERETITQMNLVYEDEANGILQCNGLDDRRVSDRIYITKVKVYKKGAAERGFPEEDLIAGLDGAKED